MSRSTLTKMLVLLAALLVGAIAWGSTRSRPLASLPTNTPEPLSKQKVIQTAIPSSLPTIEISTSTKRPYPMKPTLTASLNPTPTRPVEHYIRNISGHHQYFPLGCEAAAAKDWANYLNKDFNEFEFQYKLPLSDNPDYGFVGDVNSPWGQVPPYGYGVYAGPVADLLNAYGIQAKAYKGYTLEKIKDKVAQDKPVIAWVIGNVVGGVPYEYTDSKGNKTIVAAYEHVVIVTGYNEDHVRYMSNGKFYDTPDKVFLNSWGVLGNMVIVDN
jgi:uncharacterized protein YvpB